MKKINSLAGLRFIAIIGIYFHHFDTFDIINNTNQSLKNILFEGFTGVTFFFVLSGFVISYAYQDKFLNNKINTSQFICKRLSKLYPIHFICIVFAGLYYGGGIKGLLTKNIIPHLLLLQSFIPNNNSVFGYNGVSWSLSNELFFYFSFTVLIILSTKKLFNLFVALLLAIVFYGQYIGLNSEFSSWIFYINPLFRLVDFMTGMLLYRVTKSNKIKLFNNNKIANIAEILSIVVFIVFLNLGIKQKVDLLWRWDLYYLIPIATMIFIFSFEKGIISHILSTKLFNILGNASFAFYLIHQIGLVMVSRIFPINSIKDVFKYGIMALPILWGVAIILTYVIEKPVSKFLNGVFENLGNKCKKLKIGD